MSVLLRNTLGKAKLASDLGPEARVSNLKVLMADDLGWLPVSWFN